MKIAVGSDHRGVTVKQRIVPLLKQLGHEVMDAGPDILNHNLESVPRLYSRVQGGNGAASFGQPSRKLDFKRSEP